MRRITTVGIVVAFIFYFSAALTVLGLVRSALEGTATKYELVFLAAASFSTFVSGIIIHLITVIAIDVEHLRDHQEKH